MKLVRAEWTRILHRPLSRGVAVTALAWVALFVGLTIARAGQQSLIGGYNWNQDFTLALSSAFFISRLLATVVASASIASEHTFDTLKALLPRLPARWPLLGSKLLVVSSVAVLGTVVIELAATSPIWALGHTLGLDRLQQPLLVRQHVAEVIVGALQVCFYVVVSFGLATLSRSLAVGIVGGVGLQVGFDAASRDPSLLVAWLSPHTHFDNLLGLWGGNSRVLDAVQTAVEAEPSAFVSGVVLLAWVSLVLVPTFVIFERRDVSGAPG